MFDTFRPWWALAPAALVAAAPCAAAVYYDTERVQQALFPGETLDARPLDLDDAQVRAIEKAAGVRVRDRHLLTWRARSGGWLFIDRVLGKHEYITYALAVDAGGAVLGVEVMEYRETYGGEVRNRRWLDQFLGRRRDAALRIDDDIQNVSGATLSCVHLTEGVRRLLATHAVALAAGK